MNYEHKQRLDAVIINPCLEIVDALKVLDRSGIGILLLCGEDRVLRGIITDGDIRRAMMKGISFSSKCETIANKKPVIAPVNIELQNALQLMDFAKDFILNHLPLVDENNRIVGLLLRSDIAKSEKLALNAVVMAGGFGSRLRPLTENIPKPMLQVGNRPLLETVLKQLKDIGIDKAHITTHYKPEVIRKYFGNGKEIGIDISYINEEQPLGTAGSLASISAADNKPFLVTNGDILTKVNYHAMFEFHKRQRADLTVAMRNHEINFPYGILECCDFKIKSVEEKPLLSFLVNAGIYIVEPSVLDLIPKKTVFHMTDLIKLLIEQDRNVVGFPIHEYWLDIGKPADYSKANKDYYEKFSNSSKKIVGLR
ncbi:MAG: D-arabinose-5-phosphate isomerase [Candidatus Rifleibacterium amylolyticum]|nr:MAG: D-arabinose-5-phosphate isomerase [Candidatus Rifleibacterium amylolyticum]